MGEGGGELVSLLRGSDALGGWCEELQRDVVRIAEGQPRTVGSIDDTAVDDTESVEPGLPCLKLTSAATSKGQVIHADPALIEGKTVGRIGKLVQSDQGPAFDEPDSAPKRAGLVVDDQLGVEDSLVPR